MHELSLCRAIAGVVTAHADGRRVEIVRVRVGALRQIVPDTLAFCWTLVREFEDLADAALELELIPAAVTCRLCGMDSELPSPVSISCPRCGSADVTVSAGDEFMVTSLEVGDRVRAEATNGGRDG